MQPDLLRTLIPDVLYLIDNLKGGGINIPENERVPSQPDKSTNVKWNSPQLSVTGYPISENLFDM